MKSTTTTSQSASGKPEELSSYSIQPEGIRRKPGSNKSSNDIRYWLEFLLHGLVIGFLFWKQMHPNPGPYTYKDEFYIFWEINLPNLSLYGCFLLLFYRLKIFFKPDK
jgi:hypothetical protein